MVRSDSDPLERQVGGAHYAMTLQPVEFWQRNRWDGCACMIMKYLARHRRKNGLEDVQKGIHFVELRQQFSSCLDREPPLQIVGMHSFIDINRITNRLDVAALLQLQAYVHADPPWREIEAGELVKHIEDIAATYCAA